MAQLRQLNNQMCSMEKQLDKELSKYPIFLQLERQTGYAKTHLVMASSLGLIALLAYRFIPNLIVHAVIFFYPTIMSLRAIEGVQGTAPSSVSGAKHSGRFEDIHWLSYWVTIAAILTMEVFTGNMTAVLPFYRIAKMVLAIWLFLPSTRGATVVYERGWRHVAKITSSKDAIMKASQNLADTINGATSNPLTARNPDNRTASPLAKPTTSSTTSNPKSFSKMGKHSDDED